MKYLISFIMIIGFAGCGAINTAYECKQAGWKGVINYARSANYINSEQYCSNGEIINADFVTSQGTMPLLNNGFEAVYTEFK